MTVAFDFASEEFLADPYSAYRFLRDSQPVHWFEHKLTTTRGGMWLVTRYEDVRTVLQDTRFRKDMRVAAPELPESPIPPSMLFQDPPDHTRLRGLVNLAFTPKMVRELEPKIAQIIDQLLERMAQRREIDLIADLALPVPVIVIAEMLGVPSADRELFREWSSDVINGGDAFLASEEKRRLSQEAELALIDYFRRLIAERRRDPRQDLISGLLAAQQGGSARLSDEEMLSTCILLLIAGHETTVNLIGNGMLLLLRHPDQLQRLRENPDLVESAIEEMLRVESPVQRATFRFAGESAELQGVKIGAGQQVSAVIGAANHDERQFEKPERFDIGRSPNRHLSFGRGIHFCLGAPLARTEARHAFLRLLERFPTIEADVTSPRWRANSAFRGLRELKATLA